jgi:DNA-directed RNA polymerase subunit RPC12/RpoP
MAQPAFDYEQEIKYPDCPKCGREILKVRVEPSGKQGYDQRTFECTECGHKLIVSLKYR